MNILFRQNKNLLLSGTMETFLDKVKNNDKFGCVLSDASETHTRRMTSFESDYNNGMLPEILRCLSGTNDEKTSGYGNDPYCESAKEKIRKACGRPDAEVFFLIGGTQTNSTVIDSLTCGHEGVIAAATGHINVHESGAVEAFGHKVLALPGRLSKITAAQVDEYMTAFRADETNAHMVQPRVVYISLPTELGALYSRKELSDLYDACKKHDLYLFVDGARLGYALVSADCDFDLKYLATRCDVFYIGGTKVGAMFGEAVVFTNTRAPRGMFTIIKRHGALLAKGRMLGIQFDALFTDDLYFRAARHAVDCADRLKEVFAAHGIPMAFDSPANQQFVLLTREQKEALMQKVAFEVWEPLPDGRLMCRFVTSWATTDADMESLEQALACLGKEKFAGTAPNC